MHAIEQIPQLPAPAERHWQRYLIDSLMAAGGALVVTGIIYAFHLYPTIPNISMVYLLLPDEHGTLSIQADAPIRIERFTLSPEEMEAAQEVMVQGKIRDMSQTSPATQSASAGGNLILRLIPLKADDEVLGLLCLRIEHGVSWFASKQSMQAELEQPTDQAIFFGTFLDEAIRVIEQARLRARTISNNE